MQYLGTVTLPVAATHHVAEIRALLRSRHRLGVASAVERVASGCSGGGRCSSRSWWGPTGPTGRRKRCSPPPSWRPPNPRRSSTSSPSRSRSRRRPSPPVRWPPRPRSPPSARWEEEIKTELESTLSARGRDRPARPATPASRPTPASAARPRCCATSPPTSRPTSSSSATRACRAGAGSSAACPTRCRTTRRAAC